MAHRNIEETFQAIKPRGSRGIPAAHRPSAVGVSSGGDLSTSLSQAGQQIAQLQSVYQRQAALITANTQAFKATHPRRPAIRRPAQCGERGIGLSRWRAWVALADDVSGLRACSAGEAKPAPLPIYVPPSPVSIDGTLRR